MISLRNIHKTLNGQPVLRGIDLEIPRGETLVIIGRSGGGKSVMLRHIMGLMMPDKGEVLFEGQNLMGLSELQLIPIRHQMGMLFQNGALFDSMTVGENVAFPLREEGKKSEAEISQIVSEALGLVNLPGQESKMPAELSGGMRKRVSLARATARKPKLLLYDEPTSGLDPVVSDSINKLILHLDETLNMTNVVVTHDMKSACEIGDRIALLHHGKIHFLGTPEEIKSSQDPIVYRFVNGISDESVATE
ncbi:MAG: ABC transporter ATP-binding protein [Verrucomicrobiota bacterium]